MTVEITLEENKNQNQDQNRTAELERHVKRPDFTRKHVDIDKFIEIQNNERTDGVE